MLRAKPTMNVESVRSKTTHPKMTISPTNPTEERKYEMESNGKSRMVVDLSVDDIHLIKGLHRNLFRISLCPLPYIDVKICLTDKKLHEIINAIDSGSGPK